MLFLVGTAFTSWKDYNRIDVRQDGNAFLRADSPTISTLSGGVNSHRR